MEHATLVRHSGESSVDSGLVGRFGCSWPEHNVQSLSESARIQARDRSPHPTHTKMPRQSHDRETTEWVLKTATATHTSPDSKNDRDTGLLIANAQTLPKHTRTCNTLRDVYMCTSAVALMDMNRGTLARIDRKILAGFCDDEAFRTLRVPATGVKWATWKRYCDAAGISMGRAVAALIGAELLSVFGESTTRDSPTMAQRASEKLAIREREITARETQVAATEERLRGWSNQLRQREGELDAREQRIELISKVLRQPTVAEVKVGRNQPCPCGSGLKYKRCHGHPGHRPDDE